MVRIRLSALLALIECVCVSAAQSQQDSVALLTGARAVSELGAAVTVLDVDSLRRAGAAGTLADLLTARVPGVAVFHGSGTIGTASRILIRGATGVQSGACRLLRSNVLTDPAQSPFRHGYLRQYGLNASGGGAVRYRLAGQWDGLGGVYGLPEGEQARLAAANTLRPELLNPNYLRRVNLRGDVRLGASPRADLTLSAGYRTSTLRLPINDNNSIGILAEGLLGHADTTINQGWNTA